MTAATKPEKRKRPKRGPVHFVFERVAIVDRVHERVRDLSDGEDEDQRQGRLVLDGPRTLRPGDDAHEEPADEDDGRPRHPGDGLGDIAGGERLGDAGVHGVRLGLVAVEAGQ